MHLTRIRLGGIPPFTKSIDLQFDPQVNVFIGPNASGKTQVLSKIDERFNEGKTVGRRITSEQIDLLLTICEESDYHDDWTKGKNLLCLDAELAEAYFFLPYQPASSRYIYRAYPSWTSRSIRV